MTAEPTALIRLMVWWQYIAPAPLSCSRFWLPNGDARTADVIPFCFIPLGI